MTVTWTDSTARTYQFGGVCRTCGHDRVKHDSDLHEGMAIGTTPYCYECDPSGEYAAESVFHDYIPTPLAFVL